MPFHQPANKQTEEYILGLTELQLNESSKAIQKYARRAKFFNNFESLNPRNPALFFTEKHTSRMINKGFAGFVVAHELNHASQFYIGMYQNKPEYDIRVLDGQIHLENFEKARQRLSFPWILIPYASEPLKQAYGFTSLLELSNCHAMHLADEEIKVLTIPERLGNAFYAALHLRFLKEQLKQPI